MQRAPLPVHGMLINQIGIATNTSSASATGSTIFSCQLSWIRAVASSTLSLCHDSLEQWRASLCWKGKCTVQDMHDNQYAFPAISQQCKPGILSILYVHAMCWVRHEADKNSTTVLDHSPDCDVADGNVKGTTLDMEMGHAVEAYTDLLSIQYDFETIWFLVYMLSARFRGCGLVVRSSGCSSGAPSNFWPRA